MSTQGRAPQQESKSWYAANMGNDSQGLIIDEKTGANIAVAYDRKHAPLLAAAPAMYEALKGAIATIAHMRHYYAGNKLNVDDIQQIVEAGYTALSQAEGRQA